MQTKSYYMLISYCKIVLDIIKLSDNMEHVAGSQFRVQDTNPFHKYYKEVAPTYSIIRLYNPKL